MDRHLVSGPAASRALFVAVKAFPIDSVPVVGHDDGPGWPLSVRGLAEPVTVRSGPMSTFAYNERRALELTIDGADAPDETGATELVLRFLPSGSLVVHLVYDMDPAEADAGLEELLRAGAARWRTGLRSYALIHDVIVAAGEAGLLRHSPVAPLGILTLSGDQPLPSKEEFVEQMEWRAWSSGNYIRTGEGPVESMPRWPVAEPGRTYETRHGDVERMFNNYYGWRLCPPAGASLDRSVADELEPVAFMIARRSLCASGAANVRNLTSALVHDSEPEISISVMRRYVGLARLGIQAGNEYQEASDKLSREVYYMACEDLEVDRHLGDFMEGLDFVVEEMRAVHAENEEKRDRRLGDLVSIFTIIFGVSLVIDIVLFVSAEQPVTLSPLTRWSIVLISAVVLLAVFAAIRWRR